MNKNATEGVVGGALNFVKGLFEEKGVVTKNMRDSAKNVAESKLRGSAEHAVNIANDVAGGGKKTEDLADVMTRQAEGRNKIHETFKHKDAANADRVTNKHIEEAAAAHTQNVATEGGSKVSQEAYDKAHKQVNREVKMNAAKGTVKDYFMNPYDRMKNGATEEIKKQGRNQLIARAGVAGAGVGTVGAVGYNMATNGSDGKSRSFGQDVGNAVGTAATLGIMSSIGTGGASMLRKL
jgi:hypothetical protein